MLGRWAITYNYNLQNRKVYLTNMDHCGVCEIETDKSKTIKEDDDTEEKNLLPYCL